MCLDTADCVRHVTRVVTQIEGGAPGLTQCGFTELGIRTQAGL